MDTGLYGFPGASDNRNIDDGGGRRGRKQTGKNMTVRVGAALTCPCSSDKRA